jgi:hypothetical protein
VAARTDVDALLAKYAPCTDWDDACTTGLIGALGLRVFRRPVEVPEVEPLRVLLQQAQLRGEAFQAAAGLLIQALLQAPQFLYRLERREAATPLKTVDSFEMATRLSFLAWNSTPDDSLLNAATASGLLTAEQRAAELRRLLSDPRAERALSDYLDEWLALEELHTLSRDEQRYPDLTQELKDDMRRETQGLFADWVWQKNADLLSLLTADTTLVTPGLASLYGLTPAGPGLTSTTLPADSQRFGLLTHASILALSSGNDEPSLVSRGLFVAERLTCLELPPPPQGVPSAQAEPTPGLTQRQAFAEHRNQPACASCHEFLDPLGYPFEVYDAMGRYRTTDSQGNTLDSSGAVRLGDGNAIAYANTREFAQVLAGHPSVRRCWVEKRLQYAYGRKLEAEDGTLVDRLTEAFATAGGSYQELLVDMASSEDFAVIRSGI